MNLLNTPIPSLFNILLFILHIRLVVSSLQGLGIIDLGLCMSHMSDTNPTHLILFGLTIVKIFNRSCPSKYESNFMQFDFQFPFIFSLFRPIILQSTLHHPMSFIFDERPSFIPIEKSVTVSMFLNATTSETTTLQSGCLLNSNHFVSTFNE
jgi:hypothetical protein